jgi:hypothetical protein
MPTPKSPKPAPKIEDMTDLEASFEAAIAEAERDGYVSEDEYRLHVKKLFEEFERLAAAGKLKP